MQVAAAERVCCSKRESGGVSTCIVFYRGRTKSSIVNWQSTVVEDKAKKFSGVVEVRIYRRPRTKPHISPSFLEHCAYSKFEHCSEMKQNLGFCFLLSNAKKLIVLKQPGTLERCATKAPPDIHSYYLLDESHIGRNSPVSILTKKCYHLRSRRWFRSHQ